MAITNLKFFVWPALPPILSGVLRATTGLCSGPSSSVCQLPRLQSPRLTPWSPHYTVDHKARQTLTQHPWAPLPHLAPHHPRGHLLCTCEQFLRTAGHTLPHLCLGRLCEWLWGLKGLFSKRFPLLRTQTSWPLLCTTCYAGGTFPAPRPLPLTGLCRGFCLG